MTKLKRKVGRPSKKVTTNLSFIPMIEDFLPETKRSHKPHLKVSISSHIVKLKIGQSFFIPKTEFSISTVRNIVKKECEQPCYKNKEIRVVSSNQNEVKGCRIGRFI